jgi:hypothetical protein
VILTKPFVKAPGLVMGNGEGNGDGEKIEILTPLSIFCLLPFAFS